MKSLHHPCGTNAGRRRASLSRRPGKVLVLFVILLPVLLAITGLVFDGGGLLNESRMAQHAVDAAASAAARELQLGSTDSEADAVAQQYVHEYNGLSAATVTVSIPPLSGPLAGDDKSVEVEVVQPAETHFLAFLNSDVDPVVRTRAVARYEPSTAGAALVVLDPDPPPLAVPAIGGLLPALPTLFGGLEVLGTARVRVDGAVLVNSEWGGFDENGNLAGESAAPPSAIAVPTGLIGEKLQARDIRVVGGVDNPSYYGPFTAGDPAPLRASRTAVPDPLSNVPVPTLAADLSNVSNVLRGGVRIVDIPLLSPPRTLFPGVYDFLQIVSGDVTLSPGVYIIRSVDPLTNIGLNIIGGKVTANGVLFYITNSPGYSPASGAPDDGDGETPPPPPPLGSLLPSAVILDPLGICNFQGIDDASSPFYGMLIYQRRADRRPIVLLNRLLWGGNALEGIVYAKWGHVILSGSGFGETSVVAGTLRLIPVVPSLIAPGNLLPPAEDVFLVE